MAELLAFAQGSTQAVVLPMESEALHDLLTSLDLGAHGTSMKARVALLVPNGALAATVTLATMVRYCAVPLNPQEPAAAIASRLARSRAQCLVTVPELADAAQLAAVSASVPLVILEPAPHLPLGGFIVPRTSSWALAEVALYNSSDDIVLLLHTSGTTGESRRVKHTLRGLLAAARALAESIALSVGDVGLNMMPMHHVGGIVCNLLAPLHAGSRMLFLPRFDPGDWSWLVERHDPAITWCYAVPAMWRAILRTRPLPALAMPPSPRHHSLRLVRSGAAALPHSVALQLREALGMHVVVLPTYSCSECMPLASPPCQYALDRAGSVGPACGAITLHVLHTPDDGTVAAPREVGNVAIGRSARGSAAPQLFAGYDDGGGGGAADGDHDDNRVSLTGLDAIGPCAERRVFRTGDLGWLDEDGWLYLVGRASESIQRGGETISPAEVEAVIASHPSLLATGTEALAFAMAHIDLGETVGIALPVASEDDHRLPSLTELRGWAASSLTAAQLPQLLVLTLEPLPRTATWKLRRVGFAKRLGLPACVDGTLVTYEQQSLPSGAADGEHPYDLVRTDRAKEHEVACVAAKVQQALSAAVAGSLAATYDLNLDAPLSELGVDSLHLMRISAHLRSAMGVWIPPKLQHEAITVRALIVRVQAASKDGQQRRRPPSGWRWPSHRSSGRHVLAVPAVCKPQPCVDSAAATHCETLRSQADVRHGAVLLRLAARDEQLLLEPLAHLFTYPAFCYVLSHCPTDAEARMRHGLQACLDGAFAFLGGRFSSSHHAVVHVGDSGGVPFTVVTDAAAVLAALEAEVGEDAHLQEGALVAAAADLRSPAGCWHGEEPLLTVVLHRFTGRKEAVLAVSRAVRSSTATFPFLFTHPSSSAPLLKHDDRSASILAALSSLPSLSSTVSSTASVTPTSSTCGRVKFAEKKWREVRLALRSWTGLQRSVTGRGHTRGAVVEQTPSWQRMRHSARRCVRRAPVYYYRHGCW